MNNNKKNNNDITNPTFFNDSVCCYSCKLVAFRDRVGFAGDVLWEWGKL